MVKNFVYALILGFAFMLIFTAFNTAVMIQQTVVDSIHHNEDPDYNARGYTSLGIICVSFALANWFAPSIVILIGAKNSMIVGGVIYCVYISNFLYPNEWVLYILSVIVGIGSAIIWTAQINYLTSIGDSESTASHSGVFWALFQCSFFWGNLFIYFMFNEKKIEKHTRIWIYGVLTVVGLIGTALIFLLRGGNRFALRLPFRLNIEDCFDDLKYSLQLLFTPRMIYYFLIFFYSGLEYSFFSSIYGTSIANSESLVSEGNVKRFIGISGILIGIGVMIGGGVFGLLGLKSNRYGRDLIIILSYGLHMITLFLIYLNLPGAASLKQTTDRSYISSNLGIALICSFLLGFGSASFGALSIIGIICKSETTPSLALFKFIQSIASAIALFYSHTIDLHIHLLILAIFASLGTLSYIKIQWSTDFYRNDLGLLGGPTTTTYQSINE